jgi:mycothiol synthase
MVQEESEGSISMRIRRFVQGKDEKAWVKVRNAAYAEEVGMRQITPEEFRALEKAPEFDSKGRFMAELNGQIVGIIHAHVDKLRTEKKGFIRAFGVIPEFRGKEIEEKLADTAIRELKMRAMEVIQAWATATREDRIQLWETLGFKLVRKFSLMRMNLSEVPSNIGENQEVVLEPLRKNSDEDLQRLNWLDNECFKEHFNYRPSTLERTTYFLQEDPFFKEQAWFFAIFNEKSVGYVGAGIDEKYNTDNNTKSGWILDIGVLKPYRRRGIGTRLMLQGLETLKSKRMTTAMLGVDDWNVTKAMKLYEKVGFRVVKKDLTYEIKA